MKEYYVWSDYGQWNNMWIVLAKNAKDAIQQVYDEYIVHFNKSIDRNNEIKSCRRDELHARSLGSMHNEYGKVIHID